MNRHLLSVLILTIAALFFLASCNGVNMKSKMEKQSYAIGLSIGKDMKTQQLEIDPKAFTSGVKDAFKDKPKLKDEEVKSTLEEFQQEQIVKQQARMKEMADKNAKDGKAFLEENKTKEGVVCLSSGLQYKVINKGAGLVCPKPNQHVVVHYKGTLINGKEFDSSYSRNQPAEFQVDQVIKGWTEALQLMKKGDKWMLFIPSELAYGERGAGQVIPPNSTLIFEVELLNIK